MKINLVKAFIASTVIMFGTGVACAADSSNNLTVKLRIVDGCTVNFDMGTEINLGSYANLNEPIQRTSSFSVRCASSQGAAGTPYEVSLDAGMWPSTPGDPRTRQLQGVKGQRISYQVYQGTLPGGQVWGLTGNDVIKGKRASDATADTNNRHDFVVYVPAQGSPGFDDYADMLRATVTYATVSADS